MKTTPTFDTAAIEAIVRPLIDPGITLTGCRRQRLGDMTVIRLHFLVTDEFLAGADPVRLRGALVTTIIRPAAALLGQAVQCGDIEFANPDYA
jgi:hypothetical protein